MHEITTEIVAETFAECPDHAGRHLYRHHDNGGTYYQCPAGCDPLAELDIYLEWNERHTARPDLAGLDALYIIEYAPADY